MAGITYVNTGDWVESCTAVAEHHDGHMEIIRWTAAAAGGTQVVTLASAEAAE